MSQAARLTTMLRGILAALIAAASWIAAPGSAGAQQKPIRIIYPFPAGSAGDTVSRIVAHGLQARTGRTVIVENRAGAGGITGTRSVVSAEPDGTTLLVAPSAVVTMIPLYNPDTGYNAEKDLTAIAQLVSQDLALGVGPALPVTSLKELIEAVRKDAAKGSYGTPGAGSSLHLIGVKLAEVAGIQLTPVHYRGAAPSLNDVVAGQLPMMLSPMPDQLEQHRAKGIRIIATAGAERSPFLPEVATFREAGVDITATGWFAAFGPARMAPDVVAGLSRAMSETVQEPESRERLAKIGFMARGGTPAELQALVSRDLGYWAPVFKSAGFKP